MYTVRVIRISVPGLQYGNTACVTVKLRYSDFNTFAKHAKIPYTAHTEHALSLFERLYERRQAIRLLGVRFSELAPGSSQPESKQILTLSRQDFFFLCL